MAKDKSEAEKKEKKEKKDKKRKHEEVADEVEIVSEKKKKDKKRKSADATTRVLNAFENGKPGAVVVDADGDVIVDVAAGAENAVVKGEDDDEDKKVVVKAESIMAALVPFANPLCDEKSHKKVLKSVKKAAKHKALKRGVKECVKAIRKSPLSTPATLASSTNAAPNGIVILAADISPMDVISHIPVLCEDHDIPYVYVPSRAELGAAGSTKRPTSVVMLTPKPGNEEWEEGYREVFRLAQKMGLHVKV